MAGLPLQKAKMGPQRGLPRGERRSPGVSEFPPEAGAKDMKGATTTCRQIGFT